MCLLPLPLQCSLAPVCTGERPQLTAASLTGLTDCVHRNQLAQDLLHLDQGLSNVFPRALSKKEAAVPSSARRRAEHSVLPPDHARVTAGLFMGSRGHSTLPRTLTAPRMIAEGDVGGIAQITSSLFLGRGSVASNRDFLQSRGITCIVNATIEIPNFNWPQFEYVKVPLADTPHAPIGLYFDSVANKIHSVSRKHGATFVHCAAGVSRSATLCIAYLMKFHNVCLLEAYRWVKARRPVIRPNVGFWGQLMDYERQLFGKSTVKMVQTPYGIVPDVYEKESRHLMPYWGI